ncbi:helix-turn-helix transcriptional regulator [Acetobacterium woodii]|uniref:helix-turn-helix transcriptional regulator n=1 Tax=Acetobacterium woodii TaxID=33952 RepID=UPI0005A2D4CF|nr:helix-turn-helix transcriptional regulator [Acetobacterium woodii]
MRDWLINKRKEKKLSQEGVAFYAKVSRQYISMIETGKRDPSVKVAKLIGDRLSFDWKMFFR